MAIWIFSRGDVYCGEARPFSILVTTMLCVWSGISAQSAAVTGGSAAAPQLPGWTLVWQDEFAESKLDHRKWSLCKRGKADWNTYGCEWSAEKVIFTVNGKPTHTYPRVPGKGAKQYPFAQPFYFVLSMQIGGKWVGQAKAEHYPAEMEVDWVRVYQKK